MHFSHSFVSTTVFFRSSSLPWLPLSEADNKPTRFWSVRTYSSTTEKFSRHFFINILHLLPNPLTIFFPPSNRFNLIHRLYSIAIIINNPFLFLFFKSIFISLFRNLLCIFFFLHPVHPAAISNSTPYVFISTLVPAGMLINFCDIPFSLSPSNGFLRYHTLFLKAYQNTHQYTWIFGSK